MAATTLNPPQAAQSSHAPALLVPFTRAAKEHVENFVDVSQLMDTSSHQLGPFDVAAYGFMRNIILHVQATGGVGAPTALEDAPFSVLDEVTVLDVNGAPIVGPINGYDLFLINLFGGYTPASPDPRQSRVYSAVSATGNFTFVLRIPIEVSGRDALGSLANQNGSSTYKLRLTIAAGAKVFGTQPTTYPTVRIRAHLDAWTQPNATDLRGNPAATQPPAHGTTSYWTKTTFTVSSGFQMFRLPRIGNYIRNLFFVLRDGSGTRSGAVANVPDPFSIYWDTRLMKGYQRDVWADQMVKRTDLNAAAEAVRGLPNSVYVEDYAHDFDGAIGWELRDGWLPTVQSTRLEVSGTWGGPGTLTVITNDIAPAGEVFV